MRIFVIKAGDESTFKELGAYLRELGKTKKDVEYAVVVKANKPIRSLQSNKYYHTIIKYIAGETGHTHEQIHEICKRKFNSEVVQFPKGGSEFVGRSTKDLNTTEFAGYVNRVVQWALDEFNIVIPKPQDVTYARWMQIENNYDKSQNGF